MATIKCRSCGGRGKKRITMFERSSIAYKKNKPCERCDSLGVIVEEELIQFDELPVHDIHVPVINIVDVQKRLIDVMEDDSYTGDYGIGYKQALRDLLDKFDDKDGA